MLINKQIQIVYKVTKRVAAVIPNYADNNIAFEELTKLVESLQNLREYLNQRIKQNGNSHTDAINSHTDATSIEASNSDIDATRAEAINSHMEEINSYIEAINLHLGILREVLKPEDYKKIASAIKLLTTTLNFHPSKYTYWSFIKAWFLEWVYFI